MSLSHLGEIFYLKLPTNEKIVLLAFADCARQRGDPVYPGLDTIAIKTSMSKRNVERVINQLKKKRVLTQMNHTAPGYKARWKIETDHIPSHPKKRMERRKVSDDNMASVTECETGVNMTPFEYASDDNMASVTSVSGDNMTPTGAKSEQGLKDDARAESPKTVKKERKTIQQQSHTPNAVPASETEEENAVVDAEQNEPISSNPCDGNPCYYNAGFPCQTTNTVLDALSAETGYRVPSHPNIHATAHTYTLDDILTVYRHLRLTLKPTDTFLNPRSWMSPKIFPEKLAMAKVASEAMTTTSPRASNMTDEEWEQWYIDNGYVN